MLQVLLIIITSPNYIIKYSTIDEVLQTLFVFRFYPITKISRPIPPWQYNDVMSSMRTIIWDHAQRMYQRR